MILDNQINGISIIICCYNSANRINFLFEGLLAQNINKDLLAEIIFVDNNSEDNTKQVIRSYLKENKGLASKYFISIISENKQGLIYARIAGVRAAKYPIIAFLDDDNFPQNDFILQIVRLFKTISNIGAAGGVALPPSTNFSTPIWWEKYCLAFAIGQRAHKRSKINYVWGAGMILNRKAIIKIIDSSYTFLLTGRNGDLIISGEDQEICLILRILGYDIIYDPSIVLTHNIDSSRIDKEYVRKLFKGFGVADAYLGIYRRYLRYGFVSINFERASSILHYIWQVLTKSKNDVAIAKSLSRLQTGIKMDKKEFNRIKENINILKNLDDGSS